MQNQGNNDPKPTQPSLNPASIIGDILRYRLLTWTIVILLAVPLLVLTFLVSKAINQGDRVSLFGLEIEPKQTVSILIQVCLLLMNYPGIYFPLRTMPTCNLQ